MTHDSPLRRIAARLSGKSRDPRPSPEGSIATDDLAAEFGASRDVMAKFVARFSPGAIADNRFAAASDTMLFVHIPKTAGMSVGKAMQTVFDRFHGVEWNNTGPSFRKLARVAAYDQSRGHLRQVIMGHYGWTELQYWRNQDLPIKSGTILRDPIQRMVSNFNYNSSEAHPAHQQFVAKYPTITAYINNTAFDVQLTQAIGLVSSFDDVLTKLTLNYTFLGLTEHLGQSLRLLSRSHGLPKFEEHRTNVGTKPAEELPPAVSNLILERNHNDAKIHALLMRLYAAAEEK